MRLNFEKNITKHVFLPFLSQSYIFYELPCRAMDSEHTPVSIRNMFKFCATAT
uniref:Uncharacterized protein n=1 Tax=Arundo donax TaxID=35708 RepID=A0A0A9A1W1_ARUDO